LYIDGVQEIDGQSSSTSNDTYPYRIDGFMRGYNGAYTSGSIDEVQVYSHAITAEQNALNYAGGMLGDPTLRNSLPSISFREHELGDDWEFAVMEVHEGSNPGSFFTIGSETITAAAVTTLGISTPGTGEGDISVSYSCSNADSVARDIKVYFSTDGVDPDPADPADEATLVSASVGSVVGNEIVGADCATGTSNNSFVWDSLADGLVLSSDYSTTRILVVANIAAAPQAVTSDFTVQAATTVLAIPVAPTDTELFIDVAFLTEQIRHVLSGCVRLRSRFRMLSIYFHRLTE